MCFLAVSTVAWITLTFFLPDFPSSVLVLEIPIQIPASRPLMPLLSEPELLCPPAFEMR